MTVVAGLTPNVKSLTAVLALEMLAVPEGRIEQVDTTVRFCPAASIVSWEVALSKYTTTEPVRTAEFAAHPVNEILHEIAETYPGVTPLIVTPVAATSALPSHASVKGTPAPLQVVACASVSLDTESGKPLPLLVAPVPTPMVLVHWYVTLVEPVVTIKYAGLVVAVPVALPPGLKVTLA